jgi:cytochrome c biogenesis protein CcmG/thiol:disulfide interchange protein DsbE
LSKRQIAALAAIVIVPLAALAVVLVTIASNDDGGSSRDTGGSTATPESEQPGSSSSDGSSPTSTGSEPNATNGGKRRPVAAPDVTFPILDTGGAKGNGKLAPAFSDGKLNLDELRGTPVVLSLWSSWCDPCRSATRVIQSESQRLGPRGVLFLGLDVQDDDSQARRFRSTFGLTYPTAQDSSGGAARQLGAAGVPETFFISGNGQIVGHVVGVASLAQIELGVAAAREGNPLGTRRGGARLPLR